MILTFQIDNITDKEADDLAQDIIMYLYLDSGEITVTDYWVESEHE